MHKQTFSRCVSASRFHRACMAGGIPVILFVYGLLVFGLGGCGSGGGTAQTGPSTSPATIANSNNPSAFVVGVDGAYTFNAFGTPMPALSETGALPEGLTFTNNSNGTAVLGGTPATGTAGTYPITITAQNGVGATATQVITLTVNQTAAITYAGSAAFTLGSVGSFNVTAAGFPAPTISESGNLPAGVSFNTATGILSGTPTVTGNYPITFIAHNGIGADAIQNVSLIVNQVPSINSPNNAIFVVGFAGSFAVTATGYPSPALSESGPLPGGIAFNASTGTLSGTPDAGSVGSYPIDFTAANGVGANATQSFILTVDTVPAITTSPQSQNVNAGQQATFTVIATGTAPLSYQWQSNGVNIGGATSSTYTTPVTTGNDDGTMYTVIVSNVVGSITSTAAMLSVNTPPTINVSLENQTVAVGETATFTVSVSVTGTLPLNYQWFINNVSISGATSRSYTTPLTMQADTGNQYSVVVSNSLGTASSNTATLTLVQPTVPATYYVDFASGSDTNSGLSKDVPWQNAPGMISCSNNCTVFGLHPGDKVIFKGGVTWNASSFPMLVTSSGGKRQPHLLRSGSDLVCRRYVEPPCI